MKTPEELINEENLNRDVETLELIGFAKKLYKDNVRFAKENENLKLSKQKKSFLGKITRDYSSEVIFPFTITIFIISIIITIVGMLSYGIINHKPSGNYYLSSCRTINNESGEWVYGTAVVQEIYWGKDQKATHCLSTVDEATKIMEKLNEKK